MAPTGQNNLSISDGIHDPSYSPITLSLYWPKVSRLFILLLLSIIGTIMNGLFLSSFCVTRKKIGNLYLAIVGFADLVITASVMPIVVVVLLSGEWENLYICRFLQFLTQTATYSFSLNFAFVGAENYIRICHNGQEYSTFACSVISVIGFVAFLLSATVSSIGVYLDLDYDYCRREHAGNYHFRLLSSIFFTILPTIMVFGFLIVSINTVRGKIRRGARYTRRAHAHRRDLIMLKSNLVAYVLYVLAWLPYFVIVNRYPSSSDSTYYSTAWAGVLRSVIFGLSYGVIDRNYRDIYGSLINYCCCKVNLSQPLSRRRRNRANAAPRREERIEMNQAAPNIARNGLPVLVMSYAL